MNKQQILAKMTPEQLKKMNIPVKPEAVTKDPSFNLILEDIVKPLSDVPVEMEEPKVFGSDILIKDVVMVDVGELPEDMELEEFIRIKTEEHKAKRAKEAESTTSLYKAIVEELDIHTSSSVWGSTLSQPDAKLEVAPGMREQLKDEYLNAAYNSPLSLSELNVTPTPAVTQPSSKKKKRNR